MVVCVPYVTFNYVVTCCVVNTETHNWRALNSSVQLHMQDIKP